VRRLEICAAFHDEPPIQHSPISNHAQPHPTPPNTIPPPPHPEPFFNSRELEKVHGSARGFDNRSIDKYSSFAILDAGAAKVEHNRDHAGT